MSDLHGDRAKRAASAYKTLMRGMASQLGRQSFGRNIDDVARNYRLQQRRALVAARAAIPRSQYAKFFVGFQRQSIAAANMLQRVSIGSDYMNGMIEGPRLSLEDEIHWLVARINAYAEDVNSFLIASQPISLLVWSGHFEEAITTLDDVESKFGASMWQTSLRIALEQEHKGLEAQKAYAAELAARHQGGILAYISHHISIRNEPDVSWAWYLDDTRRRIEQSRFEAPLRNYFNFHFLGVWPLLDSGIVDVLRYEQSHSIVDIYETFVAFAQHYVGEQRSPSVVRTLQAALDGLSAINDRRLEKIRLYLGNSGISLPVADDMEATDLLKGDVVSSYRRALQGLRKSPTRVDLALVAAFARAASVNKKLPSRVGSLPSLWASSLSSLVAVFGRGSGYQGSLDALQKLSANFSWTDPGKALAAVVSAEGSTDLLRPLPDLRRIALNIEYASFCDARAGQSQGAPHSLASAYFESTFNASISYDKIDPAPAEFARAVAAARTQEWNAVADAASHVNDTLHEGVRRRATLLEATARVRLDEVCSVTRLIEREIVRGGVSPHLLPHISFIEGKTWTELKEARAQLGLSVALDLALKASGSDKIATHRQFAYDAFLDSQDKERASQLDISAYDPGLLTYFLSNVAIPTVLDMSDALEGTRDIQEERRNILSLLISIDPDNAVDYQDEILDITDHLALAEGMKLVDSSRIHVDSAAIEAWANRELADGYRRYRTLLDSGIGVADDFDLVLAKLRKGDDRSKDQFSIPTNEADDLLITLVQQLLDKFLYDPAHGLDSYLSRRIRHGSIIGFLRGPVEEPKLVSLRDETDATYAENAFWLNELSELDPESHSLVSSYLREFAQAYDDALIRLRDDLIQLKDKEHPRGLIDMRLYADVFYLVRSAVKESPSFSLFVSSCFASFWGLLDRYLRACRDEIATNLRTSLGIAFDRLRGGVNALYEQSAAIGAHSSPSVGKGLTDLTSSITNAQTNLQAALEDVQTWFARSEVQMAKRVYTLRDALNIAIQSALIRLRSYNPEVNLVCDDDLGVPAEDLSVIAEIILVTVSNACEHSGADGETTISISVHLDDTSSMLKFDVVNDVAVARRSSTHVARVATIRNEIIAESATAAVRRDRRSGLRKLGALKKRFETSSLSFGFANPGTFQLTMSVPFETVSSPTPPSKAE